MAEAHLEFVTDARRALAFRSAKAWNDPAHKLKIIGITGTKGKTTTAWLLQHMSASSRKENGIIKYGRK